MVDKTYVIMILQVLTGIVVAVIGAFIKDKFKKMDEADKDNSLRITAVEKSFSEFKEKMPLMYTTREDHLRSQASLEGRIEKLGSRMEVWFEKINEKMDSKLDSFVKDVDQKVCQINDHINKHIIKSED
jgi:hypothetical protein